MHLNESPSGSLFPGSSSSYPDDASKTYTLRRSVHPFCESQNQVSLDSTKHQPQPQQQQRQPSNSSQISTLICDVETFQIRRRDRREWETVVTCSSRNREALHFIYTRRRLIKMRRRQADRRFASSGRISARSLGNAKPKPLDCCGCSCWASVSPRGLSSAQLSLSLPDLRCMLHLRYRRHALHSCSFQLSLTHLLTHSLFISSVDLKKRGKETPVMREEEGRGREMEGVRKSANYRSYADHAAQRQFLSSHSSVSLAHCNRTPCRLVSQTIA